MIDSDHACYGCIWRLHNLRINTMEEVESPTCFGGPEACKNYEPDGIVVVMSEKRIPRRFFISGGNCVHCGKPMQGIRDVDLSGSSTIWVHVNTSVRSCRGKGAAFVMGEPEQGIVYTWSERRL